MSIGGAGGNWSERGEPADARFAALGAAVRASMARYHVPGVALGVIDGEAEHAAGFGVTSVDHPLPVDPETLFQIASITKTVVATAVMRLVEQGRVALEEPVQRHLPELRLRDAATSGRLTMTHLLTHTGGFQGDVRDGAYGVRCGAGDDALARFVDLLAHLPQHAPPGALWAYNNAGFCLAGRVIEVVTGQTFEDAIRALVLDPLGMRRSCFFASEAITSRVAIGHAVRDGRPEVVHRWALPRLLHPAGGLICPAADLLRYTRLHLGDGGAPSGERLLSASSMALLQTPRVANALHNGCLASFADEVGLSWFSRATPQGRVLVHGGETSLALRLTLVPSRRFGVFVLTNTDLDTAPMPAPPADLRHFAGTYRSAGPDEAEFEDTHVQVAGDRLTLTTVGPAAFYTPDRLVALEGLWRHERGQFLRDSRGAVTTLRMGGRLWQRIA